MCTRPRRLLLTPDIWRMCLLWSSVLRSLHCCHQREHASVKTSSVFITFSVMAGAGGVWVGYQVIIRLRPCYRWQVTFHCYNSNCIFFFSITFYSSSELKDTCQSSQNTNTLELHDRKDFTKRWLFQTWPRKYAIFVSRLLEKFLLFFTIWCD